MKLIAAPEDQGQTVEIAYGWHDGSLYRRHLDRSDGAVEWQVANQEESDQLPEGWGVQNGPPGITEWAPCDDPDPSV